MESKTCTRCGFANGQTADFCNRCGFSLQTAVGFGNPQADDFVGADEMIGTIPAREYAAFVGENAHYYLPKFKKMAAGKKSAWSWPAFFLFSYWTLYRKMSAVFAIYEAVYFTVTGLFLAGILRIVFDLVNLSINYATNHPYAYPAELITPVLSIILFSFLFGLLGLCLMITMGALGNYIYFKFCTRKIYEIRSQGLDANTYYRTLQEKGSTKIAYPLIYGGVLFLVGMALGFILLLFIFQFLIDIGIFYESLGFISSFLML